MVNLGHAGLLVQVKLQQFFEIDLGIASHVEKQHNLSPILHHLVEGILSRAPKGLAGRRFDHLGIGGVELTRSFGFHHYRN